MNFFSCLKNAIAKRGLGLALNNGMFSTISHNTNLKKFSSKPPIQNAFPYLRSGFKLTLNKRLSSSLSHHDALKKLSSRPREKVVEAFRLFQDRKKREGKTNFENLLLFSSEEVFLSTMPCRSKVKLIDNPWFVENSDAKEMLKRIYQIEDDRPLVYYLCAPSRSGKSAGFTNMFANYNSAINNFKDDLEPSVSKMPTPFDMCLYLPFENNNGNHSKELIRVWKDTDKEAKRLGISLEKIGGFYMHRCLQVLLEEGKINTDDFEFDSVEELLKKTNSKDPVKMIENMLKKHNLENVRFLVNVDEHKHISKNPKVRRGAILALAKQSNFTVLATFTEPLTVIPSEDSAGSSGVCRRPLPLSPLSQKIILFENYESELKKIQEKLDNFETKEEKNKFLSSTAKVLSHLALLKNFQMNRSKEAETELAKLATKDVLKFLSTVEWQVNSDKALSSINNDKEYPNLKELRSYVRRNIPAETVTEIDYKEFLSLASELRVDAKMENTNLVALTFSETINYFCQPLFNILRTRPAKNSEVWVNCKKLFIEEVLEKNFLNNTFIEFGYAWNFCFSKKFIEMYTSKETSYIKELKRKNLMLQKGNKVNIELLKTLETGTLYVPESVDHAGCDIFCVLNVDDEKVLICIEIKSGNSGLTNYQEEKFPELLNKAIKEVKNESKVMNKSNYKNEGTFRKMISAIPFCKDVVDMLMKSQDELMTKGSDKDKKIDRAEYLVLRPGVKDIYAVGGSALLWKEKVGSSALELLGPFVQLIPSMIETEDLLKYFSSLDKEE